LTRATRISRSVRRSNQPRSRAKLRRRQVEQLSDRQRRTATYRAAFACYFAVLSGPCGAFFLPRNAMPSQDICPSVTRRYSVSKRLYISSNFFSPSRSHTILVFPCEAIWHYSDWDPLMGTSNAGGIKNRDFEQVSRFISEMILDMEGK